MSAPCCAICAPFRASTPIRSPPTSVPDITRPCGPRGWAAKPPDGEPDEMSVVDELIARSNRLGADPRTTNYAGGNTSAKGSDTDPVTGRDVELLWVKGSGGDLGTLTPAGLAVL